MCIAVMCMAILLQISPALGAVNLIPVGSVTQQTAVFPSSSDSHSCSLQTVGCVSMPNTGVSIKRGVPDLSSCSYHRVISSMSSMYDQFKQ